MKVLMGIVVGLVVFAAAVAIIAAVAALLERAYGDPEELDKDSLVGLFFGTVAIYVILTGFLAIFLRFT